MESVYEESFTLLQHSDEGLGGLGRHRVCGLLRGGQPEGLAEAEVAPSGGAGHESVLARIFEKILHFNRFLGEFFQQKICWSGKSWWNVVCYF